MQRKFYVKGSYIFYARRSIKNPNRYLIIKHDTGSKKEAKKLVKEWNKKLREENRQNKNKLNFFYNVLHFFKK